MIIKKEFNIIFIQEPPWAIIWAIHSTTSEEVDTIISVLNYPS